MPNTPTAMTMLGSTHVVAEGRGITCQKGVEVHHEKPLVLATPAEFARRDPESALEDATEMCGVHEPPARRDRLDRSVGLGGITQLAAALLKSPRTNPR